MTEVVKKKITVLIADDEAHIRVLLKKVMESMGCQIVAEAPNGREAVELFKKTRPMLTLLDINMPVMTGKEALAEIIKDTPKAIVIMLSSLSAMDTVKECLEIGAANYIRKDTPISEMKLYIKETWNDFVRERK
jgi:two-component system chemotaxis response regulator CheY